MIDSLDELDEQATVAALSDHARIERRIGCETLEYAAHFADLHPPERLLPRRTALHDAVGERAMSFGGAGTPEVAEFAPARLAPEIGKSPYQATALIADALDLRHRLPRTWQLVRDARVWAWRARMLARRTRPLTLEAARKADKLIATKLTTLADGTVSDAINHAIAEADPERAQRLARQAERERTLHISRRTLHGTKTIFIRVDAPDAIRFEANAKHLADILTTHQTNNTWPTALPHRNPGSRNEWEAVAAALLGSNPLLAAQTLAHAHQDHQPQDGRSELREPVAADLPEANASDVPEANPSNTCDEDGPTLHEETGSKPSPPRSDHNDVAGRFPPEPESGAEPAANTEPEPDAEDKNIAARRDAFEAWLRDLDPTRLAPPATLYVHLSDRALLGGDYTARIEDIGTTVITQVRRWLGPGARVRVQPVLDPTGIAPVNGYRPPPRTAEAVRLINTTSIFPHSPTPSRRCQLDHAPAYRPPPEGPPGQTRVDKLGPLNQPEHRYRTFGDIALYHLGPSTHAWRTPYGRVLIVDHMETIDLGTGTIADTIWHAITASEAEDGTRAA